MWDSIASLVITIVNVAIKAAQAPAAERAQIIQDGLAAHASDFTAVAALADGQAALTASRAELEAAKSAHDALAAQHKMLVDEHAALHAKLAEIQAMP